MKIFWAALAPVAVGTMLLSGCSSSETQGASDDAASSNSGVVIIGVDPNPLVSTSPSASPSSSRPTVKGTAPSDDDDDDDDTTGKVLDDSFDDVADEFDDIIGDSIGDMDGLSVYPVDAINMCAGNISSNPVIVTNTTKSTQTYSVTINSTLGNEAAFSQKLGRVDLSPENCELNYNGAGTTDVVVQPGETFVSGILAGHGAKNATGGTHNIGIGAGGAAWYDLFLHLSDTDGFKNLELGYSNTGGTDPTQNVQSGLFNAMECKVVQKDNKQYIGVSNQIVTGYTSDNGNRWTYDAFEPLCFAFLDPNQGTPYPTPAS